MLVKVLNLLKRYVGGISNDALLLLAARSKIKSVLSVEDIELFASCMIEPAVLLSDDYLLEQNKYQNTKVKHAKNMVEIAKNVNLHLSSPVLVP